MIRISWFNNPHEQHNDSLRFGVMRLHRQGKLRYEEYDLVQCVDFGFAPAVANHVHRRTSVILVENDARRVKCLVDSEDSFFQISPLIREVDVYFCSGYNADFFRRHSFAPPYAWQRPGEVAYYENRARDLIDVLGDYFGRVRPYVPLMPDMGAPSVGWLQRKYRNAEHKARRHLGAKPSWRFQYQHFDARYRRLLARRQAPLRYDVVLKDTLWGWPRHRYALHRRLQELSDRYRIHSRLDWREPMTVDGSIEAPMERAAFPVTAGAIGDYETMLASSRLGVFATGLHWGWRKIMMLALLYGIPVHADRLLLEPWFDMDRFDITWNDAGDWRDLEGRLDSISEAEWWDIKARNQRAYDEVLAPEKVAEYLLATALGEPLIGAKTSASRSPNEATLAPTVSEAL